MADNEIKQVWVGDDRSALQVIQRQQKELEKLREGVHNLNHEGGEAAEKFKEMGAEGAHALVGMIVPVLNVESAVEKVVETFTEWNDKLKEIGEKFEQINKEQLSLATSMGMSATEFDKMSAALPNVTEKEVGAIGKGSRAAGSLISPQQEEALRQSVATLTPLFGQNTGEIEGFTGQAANLQSLFPGKSAADMTDLLVAMRRRITAENTAQIFEPGMVRALREGVGSGALSAEKGLALETVAAEMKLPSKLLGSVLAKVTHPDQVQEPDRGKRLSPADQAKADFAKLSPADRLNALLNNAGTRESVLGGDMANNFGLIDPQRVAKAQEVLANSRGAGAGMLADQQRSERGRRVFSAHETAVELEHAEGLHAQTGFNLNELDRHFEAALLKAQKTGEIGAVSGAAIGWDYKANYGVGIAAQPLTGKSDEQVALDSIRAIAAAQHGSGGSKTLADLLDKLVEKAEEELVEQRKISAALEVHRGIQAAQGSGHNR